MNLLQLKYVLAVEKYRNFSVAADSCYLSQSSLSQQITNLEKELGVRLFKRTTRTILVTEAGKEFISQAKAILHNVDILEQTMHSYSGLLRGTINVGAISSLEKIKFSSLITSFYEENPNLTVNISRGNSLVLLDQLEKQNIDIAFLTRPATGTYPKIQFEKIGEDEYLLAVPETHPLAQRDVVNLAELRDENFIIHEPSQAVSGLCIQACQTAGFEPNIVCRIDAAMVSMNLVRSGMGLAFFSSEEIDFYHTYGLKALRLATPIRKEIVMATSSKHPPSRLTSVFIEFVRNHIEHYS